MGIQLHIHSDAAAANAAAADVLADWLTQPGTRNLMLPGGQSPLDLYARIARKQLPLGHLHVFVLDEYGGVPADEPDNCANLLRRTAIEAWRIPPTQFFAINPTLSEAAQSIRAHEERIARAAGLDVLVLGLGQNGHLGFNEPGSTADSPGRLAPLDPVSVNANRDWFRGRYAPAVGVTVGMKQLLAARRVLLLAYGSRKAPAVKAMLQGPITEQCPASYLQNHPETHVFLDVAATAALSAIPQ
jgi:glucosamine-6-phosphate deaminase